MVRDVTEQSPLVDAHLEQLREQLLQIYRTPFQSARCSPSLSIRIRIRIRIRIHQRTRCIRGS